MCYTCPSHTMLLTCVHMSDRHTCDTVNTTSMTLPHYSWSWSYIRHDFQYVPALSRHPPSAPMPHPTPEHMVLDVDNTHPTHVTFLHPPMSPSFATLPRTPQRLLRRLLMTMTRGVPHLRTHLRNTIPTVRLLVPIGGRPTSTRPNCTRQRSRNSRQCPLTPRGS